MSKVRVHALAKELDVESKVLLTKLKAAGIKAASHQSTLSDEEVEQVRAMFGGGSGAAAPAAKKTTVVRRPKTILRRRKKDSGDDDESDSSSDESVAAASEEATEAPAAKEEPVQVVAEEKPAAASEVKAEEPEAEDVKEVEAKEAEPAEEAQEAAAEVLEPAKEKKERPKSGGATIVRRATVEEREEIESKSRRRPGRKEDHRGTRVTGMGLLSNRNSNNEQAGSDEPQFGPDAVNGDDRYTGRRKSRDRDDGNSSSSSEEEAAAAARTKKQRRANSSLNKRALLNQLAVNEDDPDAPVQPRPMDNRTRTTVFTPSATNRNKRDLKRRKDLKKTQITVPKATKRIVKMGDSITVGELAKQLSVKASDIIKKMMSSGEMVTINQTIDKDSATLIATEYNFEVKLTSTTVDDILAKPEPAAGELIERAPIVTVMGHVDHGKTSILDAIKQSNVADGEAGGITQHIGAYSVEVNGRKATFLDTPGHEAFSAMRARGAQVTDIVILVVAADDGVMPQTVEAIHHAKAAGVPIIVAVNKIDKPSINLDRVFTELTEHGIQAEEWGGDTQFVKCSAHTKEGLPELLDAIMLQSEVLELKASPEGSAEGAVIEAHLDKGRGPVATVVVRRGTLRTGDFLVAGTQTGRVRAMHDHLGNELAEAGPSVPVEIIGLSGVPMAGDQVNSVEDERTAKQAADWRTDNAQRLASSKSSAASLDELLSRVKSSDVPEVPIIVKGDTQGSVEAVNESILKLSTDSIKNRIVHSAVGGVTESDITLAAASGAVILGFNVRAARGLDEYADRQGVIVKYFSIIYEMVDTVKNIMVGKLPPVLNEVTLGHAEVRKSISVPKLGTIAGSAVLDGKIIRNANCRLIRDDIVIYDGKLGSLRRFKDDVKEVASGYECGIGIEGYNDIKEGDVIEAYVIEESAATL